MGGKQNELADADSGKAKSEPRLHDVDPIVTHGLTKFYNRKAVIRSLSMRVPRGNVYVLLGRNGAGKSTAIRTMLGLVRPDAGYAQLLGDRSSDLRTATKTRIAYLAEGHPMTGTMTVEQSIRFTRAFYEQWNTELLDQVLDHFKMRLSQEIRTLSRGQRSQIALALAVAPQPELLILDDPMAGLDTVFRIDFLESLLQIIQPAGRTILLTSHVLRDVERIADQVGILVDGVLRVDCTLDTFRASVRKVSLQFSGDVPKCPQFDGLISSRQMGQALELVAVGFGPEQRRVAESLNPKTIDVLQLSVEDAFIEYTRGPVRSLPAVGGVDDRDVG